jgi:preprotein translocase subunit SecA
MFDELSVQIREEVVGTLFHAQLAPQDAGALEQQAPTNGGLSYEHESVAGAGAIAGAATSGGGVATAAVAGGGRSQTGTQTVTRSEEQKLGRNDPCWCGSGKKFKKCHGA